jgi:cytidine deaminase
MTALKKHHFYLIESAKALIAQRFKSGRHQLAAALKTRSGKVYTGVQLKTSINKNEICAEAAAIANAANAGDTDIEALVLVNRTGEILSPCGSCRELILDYSPKAEIIVNGPGGGKVVKVGQILPLRESTIKPKS